MTRSCRHCNSPFEPVKGHQVFCSRDCGAKYWNAAWKHVHPHPSEHQAWRDMRKRCNNPKHKAYPDYGARGITVCERWDVFDHFLEDVGPRPGPAYSIERKDNDKGYEPGNCKWATKKEQAINRCNSWNPEQDAKLRQALADGLNFSQAAKILGKTVHMRAYRLGLKSNYDPHAPRASKQFPHIRQADQ